MLSVQIIAPLSRIAHRSFGFFDEERLVGARPDEPAAARSPFDERLRVVVAGESPDLAGIDRALNPVERALPGGISRPCSDRRRSRASRARSPSAIPLSTVILPFSLGSLEELRRSTLTGPVMSSFHAIPVIAGLPRGASTSGRGRTGGAACAAMRLSMFGIRLLWSLLTQPLVDRQPRGALVVGKAR